MWRLLPCEKGHEVRQNPVSGLYWEGGTEESDQFLPLLFSVVDCKRLTLSGGRCCQSTLDQIVVQEPELTKTSASASQNPDIPHDVQVLEFKFRACTGEAGVPPMAIDSTLRSTFRYCKHRPSGGSVQLSFSFIYPKCVDDLELLIPLLPPSLEAD
ncbi:hypothetical protein STEG23_017799 [Scotinomys teguina]